MALLTKTTVSGLSNNPVITAQAVASSDTIAARADATYCIVIINGGGSPDNVALDDKVSVAPEAATGFDPDAKQTVTNATTRVMWIRDARRFIDPATGLITITHSFTTSVTCYVIELL